METCALDFSGVFAVIFSWHLKVGVCGLADITTT